MYLFVFSSQTCTGKARCEPSIVEIVINRETLEREVKNHVQSLSAPNLNYKQDSRWLYDLLITRASSLLNGKQRLIIIPDGILWKVPFQALLSSSGEYLIDKHVISYAPSLSSLLDTNDPLKDDRNGARPERKELSFLGIGNPEFNKRMDKLRLTGDLISQIANSFYKKKTLTLTNYDATEENVRRYSTQSKSILFATHAKLDSVDPLNSKLILGRPKHGIKKALLSSDNDGILQAWEILNMNFAADHIILAACETGDGEVREGEGLIGIAWSFLASGATNVVASQWSVDETATTHLIASFYEQLQTYEVQGKPADTAEALRYATLKTKKQLREEHPFYWGGFINIARTLIEPSHRYKQ